MASIQKRPNGKYLVRWRNEENRERSKIFSLKRDARRYAAQIDTDLARGDYVDPRAGDITLQAFFDDWQQRQVWEETTRENAVQVMKVTPFADTPLNKIRRSHVESWVKTMQTKYAVKTLHSYFQTVRAIIRGAIRDDLIAKDPTSNVRLPRLQNRETSMRIPTAAEVKTMIDAAEQWFKPVIALGAFAGLRRGEIAALKLTDIDFLGRSIRVDRQIQKPLRKEPEIREPKHGSNRTVYAPDELLVMLSEHVKNVGVYSDEQWLFAGKNGYPKLPTGLQYRWDTLIKNTNIEGITLHDLRHFFASGLIASGCDVVTVQRAMGHSSASITLNTYSHLWPDAADRTRAAAGGLMRDVFNPHEDQVRTKNTGIPV